MKMTVRLLLESRIAGLLAGMADECDMTEAEVVSLLVQREADEVRTPAGHVWVVTDPSDISTEADCVFSTTAAGMLRQALGGLNAERHRPAFHFTHADAVADFNARVRKLPRR